MTTPLPFVTALARSGALDRAWALFEESGYALALDNPAALAVKGRLLKDRALLSPTPERVRLLGEARSAYAAADALAPQPWLAINVATLSHLLGERDRAEDKAEEVLARLQLPDIAETPYYIDATRAEAELLRGDQAASAAALAQAVAHDPDGWRDRASTLRQLGLILDHDGADKAWLDQYRPPRSLHYAGHMAVAEDAAGLSTQINDLIDKESIGFGYGALAAGADIVIAEALLRRGAALHVILPTSRDDFMAQSVLPFGTDWQARFAGCLHAAASVRIAAHVSGAYEPLATALAADRAMGAALLNARQCESEALQLLVRDEEPGIFGGGAATTRDGSAWQATGARQIRLSAPRATAIPPSSLQREGRPDRALIALVRLDFDGLAQLDEHGFAIAHDAGLPAWLQPAEDSLWMQNGGDHWVWAFSSAAAAAFHATHLHARIAPHGLTPVISLHYGIAHRLAEGWSGAALFALARLARTAWPGAMTASKAFAVLLSLDSQATLWRCEYCGDAALLTGEEEEALYTLHKGFAEG